jgi:putative membrane protein
MNITPQLLLSLPFVLCLVVYLLAVFVSNRRYHPWPWYRSACWIGGVLSAIAAVAGPLADREHMDFTAHMLGHLLLGMMAPLLMVLGAPITLILRTVSVPLARRLTRALKFRPFRLWTHPVVAALLNIGGLWLLYTTDLYSLMHMNPLLHLAVHVHLFAAGYLFTASMIYLDPLPHRFPYLYRAAIWILALAGHGVLSKYIYAHPPAGVPAEQARLGGMLMYYGGDAIELAILIILCSQWFRASRPVQPDHAQRYISD